MATREQDTAITDVDKPVGLEEQRDCLIIIHHKEKGQQGKRPELHAKSVRLGRDADNDLVPLDQGVSRDHARIERRGESWLVDVGSRNGTLLNGQPLSGLKRLKSGDMLKLGSVIVKPRAGQVRSPLRAESSAAPRRGATLDSRSSTGQPHGTAATVSACAPSSACA